ncbi:hypothetical protein ACFLTM_05265 [Candidatus Bipolaricaulota bacterium]
MSRVVLVLVIVCVVVGFAGSAAEFDGRLFSITYFGHDPLEVYEQLYMDIEYSLSGWTLGAHSMIVGSQFTHLIFDVEGSLGPFHAYSIAMFRPSLIGTASEDGTFAAWNSIATLSLGGVNLYAISLVSNYAYFDGTFRWAPGETGVGLRLGGWGLFGPVKVFVETRLNVENYVYLPLATTLFYWSLGFEEFIASHRGVVKWGDSYGWPFWHMTTPSRYMMPQTTGCTLPWRGAEILLVTPVACHDVVLYAKFNPFQGFDRMEAFIEDVDLGLDWLELAYALVGFGTTYKRTDVAFALNLADTACVKPFFALEELGASTVDGISLKALTLEYEVSPGVLLKAGEKFSDTHWEHFVSWTEQYWHGWTTWGEIEPYDANLWLYVWDGVFLPSYEEYIAIEIDGDACCGGSLDAFLYAWFDTDQTTAFMDWAETVLGIRAGVGSNTTLLLTVYLDGGGLDGFYVGAEFVW